MANNSELDLSVNVTEAERNIARLTAELNGLTAALTQTAGIISTQMKASSGAFIRSIKLAKQELGDIQKALENPKLGDRQRTRLQQRANSVQTQITQRQDREMRARDQGSQSYARYGSYGNEAKQRQQLFTAFMAELNKQQQTILRFEQRLRQDRLKAELDGIRLTSNAINAAIAEQSFKTQTLIKRTTPAILAARASQEDERLNRLLQEQQPRRRAFRDNVYQTRVARENDLPLQSALQARRNENDEKVKYRYSVDGMEAEAARKRMEDLRREAIYENSTHDAAMRQLRAEAELENRNHDRRMRQLRAEAELEYRLRYGRSPNSATRTFSPVAEPKGPMTVAERRQRAMENAPIQAQYLGQYAAIATIFGGLTGIIANVVRLEEELKKFQAISASTNSEMVKFTASLLQVSQGTRFSSVEVAEAATTMAQAGLSLREVQNSIASVTQLATASGSTLAESVDLVTSILGTFNLQSSQTSDIANVMTEALNRTKLTVDKLALGVQYAGNVASDAGVSYTELTAILGALSNTGIRSGSTLGTGLRQLFIDIQKPSENFQKVLRRIGLTMADVDIKTNGFVGVLSNLQKAGFSASDAIDSFEVRAASAFTGLSNNQNAIGDLVKAFSETDAASEAAAVQMESFGATGRRALTSIGNVAYTSLEPTLAILQDLFEMFSRGVNAISGYSTALGILGTVASAFIGTRILAFVGGLATSFLGLGGLTTRVATGIGGVTLSVTALTAALRANPLFIIGTLASVIGVAVSMFKKTGENLDEVRDRLKGIGNEIQGEIDATQQSIQSIKTTVRDLATQSGVLNDNPIMRGAKIAEVKNAFREFGLEINTTTGTIGELIEKLVELEGKLNGQSVAQYAERIRIGALETQNIDQQIAEQVKKADYAQMTKLLGRRPVGSNPRDFYTYSATQQLGGNFGEIAGQFFGAVPPLQNRDSRNDLLARAQLENAANINAATVLERKKNAQDITAEELKQLETLNDRIAKEKILLDYYQGINNLLNRRSKIESDMRSLNDSRALSTARGTQIVRDIELGRARQEADFYDAAGDLRGQSRNTGAAFQLAGRVNQYLIDQYEQLDVLTAELTRRGVDPDSIKTIVSENRTEIDTTASKMMKTLAQGFLKGLRDRLSVLEASGEKGGAEAGDIRNLINRIEGQETKNYRLRTTAPEVQRKIFEQAQAGGLDPAYALSIAGLESNFDPNVRNKAGSSAKGLYQFTFGRRGRGTGYKYGLTGEQDSIEAQTEAMIKFTADNRKYLRDKLGQMPTNEELAIAHFAGAGGAVDLLRADRGARADSVGFGGNKLSQNGLSADATVGDVINKYIGMYRAQRPSGLVEVGQRDEGLLAGSQAASKAATADTANTLAQSKLFKNPEEIRKLREKIEKDFADKLEADLKVYDELNIENKNDPAVVQGRADVQAKNLEDKNKALVSLTKQEFKTAEDLIDERVKQAEARLEAMKNPDNVNKTSPFEIAQQEIVINNAKKTAATEKEALAVKYLNQVKAELARLEQEGQTRSGAYTDLLEAQSDAEKQLAEATKQRGIIQSQVNDKSYQDRFNQGTSGYLQSQGVLDSNFQIKDSATQFGEAWEQALSGVSDGIQTLGIALVKAPKDAKEAFKQFGNSVIDMLLQMISKALTMQLIMGAFGTGTEGNTGFLGGLFGGSGGFLSGLFSTPGMARGGMVRGGVPGRDSVLRKLMPGEVVMNTSAVRAMGADNLLAINSMGANIPSENQVQSPDQLPADSGGGIVNVWVVSPDQQPPIGPNDVVAIVGENIRNRGSIKQLIKQVQMGG